jgi:putative membrane protein
MVSDHQKAGDDLDKIASNKGVTVDDKLSAKDQAELDRLNKLQGASFDREYVKSQLAAHKAAVALFGKESKSGNDSELKSFAASTLPTLQDHLQLVEQLSKSASHAAATPARVARTTES